MAQVPPLLSHASLLRVSLDEASDRPRVESVIVDLDGDGIHTEAPTGAQSSPSSPLPVFLEENTVLWTSVEVFAERLLQRQQHALDQLRAIENVSAIAVTQQHKSRAKGYSGRDTPSRSVSFPSVLGGPAVSPKRYNSSDGASAGQEDPSSAEDGVAVAHTVPSTLRYASVLSSTDEDGHVNPIILQPVAEEGCYLQVASRGFVRHCANWATSSSPSSSTTTTRAALPLPDTVRYSSDVIAQRRQQSASSTATPPPVDEGVLYGYTFFLCGEAFCPANKRVRGGNASSDGVEIDEETFAGTINRHHRRHRARGVVLVLVSTSPVLSTLRTLALEVVVCLVRLAARSHRDDAHHLSDNLDRLLAQELAPLVSLTQPRGVSTTTMPGQPMLLQLPSCDRPVNVWRPADCLYPHIDLPLHVLMCSFSFDALRVLHALLIQERRVVVIGCTPQHASACVTSAIALLSPLVWCAPLVPYLPPPTSPPSPPHEGVGYQHGRDKGMSAYACEGSEAEWWLLDALFANPDRLTTTTDSSSRSDETRPSTGFLVGSTAEIIAPLMLRLSALEATTAPKAGQRQGASQGTREDDMLENRVWVADARSGMIGIAPLDPLATLTPSPPPSVPSPADLSAITTATAAASGAFTSLTASAAQLTSAANRVLFSVNAANRPFAALELPPGSEKLKNAVKKSISPEKRQAFRVAANAQQARQLEWFAVCAQEVSRLMRFAARAQRRRRRGSGGGGGGARGHRLYGWPHSMLVDAKRGAHRGVDGSNTANVAVLSIRNTDSLEASLDSLGGGDDEGEDGYQPTARVTGAASDDGHSVDWSGDDEDGSDNSSTSSRSSHTGSGSSGSASDVSGGVGGLGSGSGPRDTNDASINSWDLTPFGNPNANSRLQHHTGIAPDASGHSAIVVEAKDHRRHQSSGDSTSKSRRHRLHRPHLRKRDKHRHKNASPAAGKGCHHPRQLDAWGQGLTPFVHHSVPEHDGQHRLPSFPSIAFDDLVDVHAAFLEYNAHRLVGSYRKGLLLSNSGHLNNGTGAVQPAGVLLANRVGGIDVGAFLPATLGNSATLSRRIASTASFRQFMQTALCVEKLRLSSVLSGTYLMTNRTPASSSAGQDDCANNVYVASPRLFCLLGLFYERARRRFTDLFPDVPHQLSSASPASLSGGGGDAVRNCLAVAQQLYQHRGSSAAAAAAAGARPLRNVFTDGGNPAAKAGRCVATGVVRALGIIAGRSGDELQATIDGGAAGSYCASAVGGGGSVPAASPTSGGGGVRRFFTKASKAMKHGLGGSTNTSGHTQTFALPVYCQCLASIGTGPISAYMANRRTDQGKDDLFLGVSQQRQRARRVASQQQYAALHTDFSLPDSAGHCVAYDFLPTGNNSAGLPVSAYANTTTPQAHSEPRGFSVSGTRAGGGMEAEYLRAVANQPITATTSTETATSHFSASRDPIANLPLLVRQLPVDVIHHFAAYHALLDPTVGTASTGLRAIVHRESLPSADAVLAVTSGVDEGGGSGGDARRRQGVQLILPSTSECQYLAQLAALIPASVRVQSTAAALYEMSLVCPLPPPPPLADHTVGENHTDNHGEVGDAATGHRTARRLTPLEPAPSSQPLAATTAVVAPAPDVFHELFGPSQSAGLAPSSSPAHSHADPWAALHFTSGAPEGYVAQKPSPSGPSSSSPSAGPSPPSTAATAAGTGSPASAAAWDAWWSSGPATVTGPSPPPPLPAAVRAPQVSAPAPGNAFDELFSFGSGAPQDGVIRAPQGGYAGGSSSNNNNNRAASHKTSLEDFF